ncbi:MAG: PEP-CTERM-box response regulator transcription factor [Nitrospirota bacterium]
MEKLLIIEDNDDIVTQLKWGLSKDYRILTAVDREKAMDLIRKERPGVATLDLGLPPDPDGTEEGFICLKDILEEVPHAKVIVITGNDERESAHKAVNMGAYDFYQKPINLSELKIILERAFYLYHIEQENRRLQEVINRDSKFEGIIGDCQKMQDVFLTIKKVAASEATILITGESGTGKELVARAIHKRSIRTNRPFIPINCGGIPDTLIESELFGYEKGAFTDAKTQRIGMIERANEGTLFLDEIGELPVQLQVKLLRFLQDKKIQRLGGREEIEIDTRIIAATNIDLQRAIIDGKFREDLYFRIGVITIELPPLRERGDDILLLAYSFLNRFNHTHKKKIKGFDQEAVKALKSYEWPGNIRELENKVQRAVVMADDRIITTQDLSMKGPELNVVQQEELPHTLKDIRERAEIGSIKKALIRNAWNISKTAEELGISRPTLHDLMNKYRLKAEGNKRGQESTDS